MLLELNFNSVLQTIIGSFGTNAVKAATAFRKVIKVRLLFTFGKDKHLHKIVTALVFFLLLFLRNIQIVQAAIKARMGTVIRTVPVQNYWFSANFYKPVTNRSF